MNSSVSNLIEKMENDGYLYLQMWQGEPSSPDRVRLPSGEILDEFELHERLKINPNNDLRYAKIYLDAIFQSIER